MTEGPKRTLFLVWREPESRAQYKIAQLSYDGFSHRFRYDHEGLQLALSHGFSLAQFPLAKAFPDIHKEYESVDLFPAFAHRLPHPNRPDYQEVLSRFQLRPDAHPFEILRKTRGRLATDQLSLEEAPTPSSNGVRIECYVAGWRFHRGDLLLDELIHNMSVRLQRDKSNPYDPNAVEVLADSGEKLGYIPAFHSEIVARSLSTGRTVRASIIELNPPPAPSSERAKIEILITGRRDVEALREIARQGFRSGLLPRSIPEPLHESQLEGYEPIIIGRGTGQRCSLCGQQIDSSEEVSIQLKYRSGQQVSFHNECFDIWNEVRGEPFVRRRSEEKGSGARSPSD